MQVAFRLNNINYFDDLRMINHLCEVILRPLQIINQFRALVELDLADPFNADSLASLSIARLKDLMMLNALARLHESSQLVPLTESYLFDRFQLSHFIVVFDSRRIL